MKFKPSLLILVTLFLNTAGCSDGGDCTPEAEKEFCDRLGKNCNIVTGFDNCGVERSINCGTCTLPETCGGGGTANVCGEGACTPTTCAAEGKNCGTISDGCSANLECGTCTLPETCGGGGTANVCGEGACTPDCTGQECGPDGCGGTCSPGCSGGDVCNNVSGQCVVPTPGIWVFIEAGAFTMGSPDTELGRGPSWRDETQHDVTLTNNFEILSSEVTQQQFETLMGWNPSIFTGCGSDCPVERISWYDAVAYTNKLSEQKGYAPCYVLADVECRNGDSVADYMDCMNTTRKGIGSATVTLNSVATPYDCEGYRLPTEAEWEYAARADTMTAFYNGDITNTDCSDPNMNLIGWYCGNSDGTTHPVGQKDPNAWGLYDTSGNVMEWCHDWFGDYSGVVTDPWGPANGTRRVLRNGDWYDDARYARAASRLDFSPGNIGHGIGARVARSSH